LYHGRRGGDANFSAYRRTSIESGFDAAAGVDWLSRT